MPHFLRGIIVNTILFRILFSSFTSYNYLQCSLWTSLFHFALSYLLVCVYVIISATVVYDLTR